jgi:glycosyltransferase involved in cell wall biosynthesis
VSAQAKPRRLRIAVLNRNFDPTGGGAERYSIALVEQLAARHDIHVFAQTIRHQYPGVTYHPVALPLKRPRWINQLWFAYATWRATRHGFDVVHSHENTWHGQVQTVHVLPIRHNLFVGRTGLQAALRWLKVATSVRLLAYFWLEKRRYAPMPGRSIVATSNTLRDVLAATHPQTLPMLTVITPGIASVPGAPDAAKKRAARDALGLPANAPLILFVANDFHKKGLGTLLEALALLRKEERQSGADALPPLIDPHLAVVGNPAHADAFAAPIKRLGLHGRVSFLGQLRDVGVAYDAADALAHPTLEDTFGMVVLEAMAHGLPVVVSGARYCGIAQLLTPGENALILPDPTDARSLANALRAVLTDVSLRARLTRAASAFAEGYKWSNLSLDQESIYMKSLLSHE